MLLMCFSAAPSVIVQRLGDARVRAALGHRREDLALARRQHAQAIVGAGA